MEHLGLYDIKNITGDELINLHNLKTQKLLDSCNITEKSIESLKTKGVDVKFLDDYPE